MSLGGSFFTFGYANVLIYSSAALYITRLTAMQILPLPPLKVVTHMSVERRVCPSSEGWLTHKRPYLCGHAHHFPDGLPSCVLKTGLCIVFIAPFPHVALPIPTGHPLSTRTGDLLQIKAVNHEEAERQ